MNFNFAQRKSLCIKSVEVIDDIRYKNTENIEDYINGVTIEDKEVISIDNQMAEYMFLGLRMKKVYQFLSSKEFNVNLLEKYKSVIESYRDFIIVIKIR